jgi:hypothetical protein
MRSGMDEATEKFWRAAFRVPDNQTIEAWIRDHAEVLPNGNYLLPVSGIIRFAIYFGVIVTTVCVIAHFVSKYW